MVPAVVYQLVSNRMAGSAESELKALLLQQAKDRTRVSVRIAADERVRELDERSADIVRVLDAAAATVRVAIAAGPDPGLPAETLLDRPGHPLRSGTPGPSAALVSRASPDPLEARRDLSMTRRVESTFASLLAGQSSLSALYVSTKAGVLRSVPWRDLTPFVEAGVQADFKVPGKWEGQLRALARREGELPLIWTGAYEDRYAGRGRIVTAITPIHDARDEIVALVGADWALDELVKKSLERHLAEETEVLLTRTGELIFRFSGGAAAKGSEAEHREILALGLKQAELDIEASVRGQRVILATRWLRGSPWAYGRLIPVSALQRTIDADVEPIFRAARERRQKLQAIYLVLLLALTGLLVAVSKRATASIRRVARFADAIAHGGPPSALSGEGRQDELGRLIRAMKDLANRVRRRIAFMQGQHEVARAAAVMTRSDHTYARLTQRIAELVAARKSWLYLYDGETRSLVLTLPGYGLDGIDDEQLREGVSIGPSDHSLAMLAFKTSEMFVSNDLHADPRVSMPLVRMFQLERNVVFAPLKTEAGVMGVMVVSDKAGPFDLEDQAAIQGYADQAALLLRNARLYEELQRSYEKLRDAHRHRDYFLQNINHELRTPLTAILGWSEVLAEDKPGPDIVATAVEQIRRSAQFLLTLISDLLDLSRFEEGGTRLERSVVDLGALVREAIEPVAVMAEGKGIGLHTEAPAEGQVPVKLDPIRMRQVLWNLVHNAVKFTPQGGRIDVKSRVEGGEILFTVEDDGVGIDPKDLPRIFERFRQGDGSTTRAYRGTGIGLALARAYIELHGGVIEAESRPGRGARFRVRIPISDSASDAEGAGGDVNGDGDATKPLRPLKRPAT